MALQVGNCVFSLPIRGGMGPTYNWWWCPSCWNHTVMDPPNWWRRGFIPSYTHLQLVSSRVYWVYITFTGYSSFVFLVTSMFNFSSLEDFSDKMNSAFAKKSGATAGWQMAISRSYEACAFLGNLCVGSFGCRLLCWKLLRLNLLLETFAASTF